MPVCEICWTEASHRALLGQGMTTELYREELVKHPEHCACPPPPRRVPAREELREMADDWRRCGGVLDYIAAALEHQGGHL